MLVGVFNAFVSYSSRPDGSRSRDATNQSRTRDASARWGSRGSAAARCRKTENDVVVRADHPETATEFRVHASPRSTMMARMNDFRTGFVALPLGRNEPAGPFHGSGWTAILLPEARSTQRVAGGLEIVIRARSWAAAQRAVDLLNGSRQLMNGNPDIVRVQHIAYSESEPAWMDEGARGALPDRQLMSQEGLPTACAIAAKASRRRRWSYAVARYKFSVELCSVHWMDMHPAYGVYHRVSSHPDDHVLFSHAILSAFGVIEDLGLAVPAGPLRPSRRGGAWNPDVLKDLQARLLREGIDPAQSVLWSVRGPARRIERKRPLPPGASPSWAGGQVRDRRLAVADAIGYSDFLRDRVAAHGVKDLTRSLSPYDVVNVQALARFLLLSSMDFRVWQRQA